MKLANSMRQSAVAFAGVCKRDSPLSVCVGFLPAGLHLSASGRAALADGEKKCASCCGIFQFGDALFLSVLQAKQRERSSGRQYGGAEQLADL